MTELIPEEVQPPYLFDNLINELLRAFLAKHAQAVNNLYQERLRQRQQNEARPIEKRLLTVQTSH